MKNNISFYSVNMETRYKNAQILMQGKRDDRKLAINTTVTPFWIGDTGCFWYVRETEKGRCYRWVDTDKKINVNAFDHKALAYILAGKIGKKLTPKIYH
ncbi:hypothetical protein JYU12_02430 [bacterium AH-315-K03]|nr:hypothetical protein [bacterium AH-315-K03]